MLVELVCLAQVARLEESGFISTKQTSSTDTADVITNGVTENRPYGQQDAEEKDVEIALGRQNAGGDEQGITREKKPDEQTRLGEDDHREADVPAPRDQGFDVPQAMKELEQLIHA